MREELLKGGSLTEADLHLLRCEAAGHSSKVIGLALALEAKPKAQLNCAVAEISPDYSYADRQKCRLIRGHKL
jgi:hypothetical protein